MEDPICLALAEVCSLDPHVNERKLRTLAQKLRLAGYFSRHIRKLPEIIDIAMPESFYGNRTLQMVERYILNTREDDDESVSTKPTLCIFVDGKPKEWQWKFDMDDHEPQCDGCAAKLSVFAYSDDAEKAQRLYCHPECLANNAKC